LNRLAVIVVTHNSSEEVGACLDSVHGLAETIVVDNASVDDTLREVRNHPWARLIANDENRGFAGGVNQGVYSSSAELFLLLNPDACLLTPLQPMIDACREYGLATGQLVGDDGAVQKGFNVRRFPTPAALSFEALGLNRLWPGNPVNRSYRYLNLDLGKAAFVEQPAGAFLMFRRDVFEELGGFDEAFHPVWFEDVDFAKRAAERGFRARYVPSTVARHSGGHSVGRIPGGCRPMIWYASLLRYAANHFSSMQFRAVCGAVAAGCARRFAASHGERRLSEVYWRVIRVATASLFAGRLSPECIKPSDFELDGRRNENQHSAKVHTASHTQH
jgi:N-acetylglucosaminyl-diphospho-decaprenol L-rhamnosyltransferase